MCAEIIEDGDALFRHIIIPIMFRQNAFAPHKFIRLQNHEDGVLGSLAWAKYLPTAADVHAYGCRLEASMNKAEAIRHPVTDKNRRLYCGAYELTAIKVRLLSNTVGLDEILSADVIHHEENGEIAHVDLKITPKAGRTIDEDSKTAIVDRLWHSCTGPIEYHNPQLPVDSEGQSKYQALPCPPAFKS